MNDQLHPEHGYGIAGSNSIFFTFFFSGGGQSSLNRFQRSRQGANNLTVFFFLLFHASSTRYHSCKLSLKQQQASFATSHAFCIKLRFKFKWEISEGEEIRSGGRRGKSRNVVITAAMAGPLEEAEGLRFNRKQQRDWRERGGSYILSHPLKSGLQVKHCAGEEGRRRGLREEELFGFQMPAINLSSANAHPFELRFFYLKIAQDDNIHLGSRLVLDITCSHHRASS